MTKLSKHFSRHEFACSCPNDCGADVVDIELITVLENLRTHFNSPITINSGHRCIEHNIRVGGSLTSQHLTGRAADIVVKDVPPHEVATYLRATYPDTYGIGEYDEQGFVHFDCRKTKARWIG